MPWICYREGPNMPGLPSRKGLAVFAVTGLLYAEEAAIPQEDPTTIRTTVRVVMTPVSVNDRSGSDVTGLGATDFRLFDNGKPQNITEDMAAHPISLVIAIQANSQVEKILPQIQKLGAGIQQQIL